MKNMIVCLIASLLTGLTLNATAADAPDLKYGLYIYYGIDSFAQAGDQGQIPAARFNPVVPDVKQWAHAAKQAGATFAVIYAKNSSGFCLWDSPDYDYDGAVRSKATSSGILSPPVTRKASCRAWITLFPTNTTKVRCSGKAQFHRSISI